MMNLRIFIFCCLAFLSATVEAKTILIIGDSLSAAYGLKPEEGWVSLLQKKMSDEKRAITVVNGAVSGDTTANGRARLPALIAKHKPTTVVIVLGGNDALRGASVVSVKQNLEAMASLSKTAKAKVAIIGLELPPNFGAQYNTQFQNAFSEVAKKMNAPMLPSILTPLGASLEYFQPDKIHPTAKAQPLLLKHVWPTIEKSL